MKDLLARLQKKPLAQVFNILAGIIVLLMIIEEYTILDINFEWLNFVSIEHFDINESIMWIWTILLFVKLWYSVIKSVAKYIYVRASADEDELVYGKMLVWLSTIEDILQLIASIYGFVFSLMAYSYLSSHGEHYFTFLAQVTYIGILYRFSDTVFFHYYYTNRSIVSKAIASTRDTNNQK